MYTYAFIIELCQQVFIYNGEAQFTSDTSCAGGLSCHKVLLVITVGTHCFQ